MSRSSIFSFETLQIEWRAPRGLLLAIVLLAAFDALVARQQWVWAWLPRSRTGVVDALESQVIGRCAEPSAVILGDSRVRDAVAPRVLERALGLPSGSALNLGLTSGTLYDALCLYRRNRDKLGRARFLVVGLSNRDFRPSLVRRVTLRYRRYATLRERLTEYGGRARIKLVVGWLWRTYDARTPIRNFLRTLVDRRVRRRAVAIAEDGRVVWRKRESDIGPDRINLSRFKAQRYAARGADPVGRRRLQQLIDLAREDGVCVLLIRIPFRTAYAARIWPQSDPLDTPVEKAVEGLTGVQVRLYRRADEVGIPDNYFYDYGHMTRLGAKIMTRKVAELLRTMPCYRPAKAQDKGAP